MRKLILSLCFVPAMFAAASCDSAVIGASNVNPTSVYQTDVADLNFKGCLSATTGLASGGNWTTPTFIAWDIALNNSGTGYRYTYTFDGSGAPGVSHFIVGLSNSCTTFTTTARTGANECIWNLDATGLNEIGNFGQTGGSNPGIPGSMYGIKFNTGADPITITFESSRIPMWQNFYAKGGSDSYVYNKGFGSTTSPNYFIAGVDSRDVPEPGFYGLLSLGVAGLWAAYRRRNQAV
jgi:hypothetical protein